MINGFILKQSTQKTLHNHIDATDLTDGQSYLVYMEINEKNRSLDQNSLSHEWYAELAKQLPQDDELGWKCYCKLHHGVPLLRSSKLKKDAKFRKSYDAAIKGLTYEQKIEVMKILPVTSLMNTKQLSAYLESVQKDFMNQGVILEFPNEQIPQ